MTDRTGQVLGGRYRLLERIGAGGMSEVYRAEHVELGRPLAVKLLLPAIAADQVAVERLRREAMATSNLGHPNIVQIADFDTTDDGAAYLVMEWLEGETLAERLRSLAVEDGLALVRQACEALAAAHEAGVIHRDVKPANLFVTGDRTGRERLVVLDFGIAKLADDQHLTRTGTFIGTPDYMSPEQAQGLAVDARTDVYAIGVILYELVARALPFASESVMEILSEKIATDPVPPSEHPTARPAPAGLEAIIMRCLARDPDARYATMDELAAALRAADQEPAEPVVMVKKRSRRPRWAVPLVLTITAAAISVAVYATVFAQRTRTVEEPPLTEAQIRFGTPELSMLATVTPLPVEAERPLRVRVDFAERGPAEVEARYVAVPAARPEYEARVPVTGGSVTFGLVPRAEGAHRLHLTAYDEAGDELGAASFGICVGGVETCPPLATPDAPGSLFP